MLFRDLLRGIILRTSLLSGIVTGCSADRLRNAPGIPTRKKRWSYWNVPHRYISVLVDQQLDSIHGKSYINEIAQTM